MITYYETTMAVEPNLPPYRYHQIAWKGFLDQQGGDTPFQVYVARDTNTMVIRSVDKPSWPPYFNVEVSTCEAPEDEVEFDLLLDPCKRGEKEYHLEDPNEIMSWVLRKLKGAGIEIEEAHLRPVPDFPRIESGSGRRIPANPWEFRIKAKVQDRSEWEAALHRGVGRKKRFGFGMIRPR